MSKKSYNPIPQGRMDIDWERDPSNGLPYSGQSVQAFIKQEINAKAGAGLFVQENMTLYLFATEEDKLAYEEDPTQVTLIVASIPIRFETTQFRIRITPDRDTTMNISIKEEQILLGMGVVVETRQVGESWSPTNDDVHVRVYIDANTTGVYVEVPELAQDIKATDGRLELDVKKHIPIGRSRVRLYFSDKEDDSITSSIVWNINLAEMYIEEYGVDGEENAWYNAIVENGLSANYKLGAFKVVGNIPKTVHFAISTAYSVVAYFEDYISTEEYIDRRYNFTRTDGFDLMNPYSMEGEALSALATGSYNVKVWLTSGDLSTEDTPVVYNIMYVAPGDESAMLVVMNNYGKEVNNYDQSAHLCDYAIYNGGASYANPTITITPYIGSRAETPYIDTIRVTTGELHSLIHGINMNVYGDDLSVTYRVALSELIYQEHSSSINNKEIFPAEGGETFYLNPGLRSNSEEATRTDVYNVANNGKVALEDIVWTKMSWVDGIDGWTKDDNNKPCLMLPARTRLSIPASSYMFMPGEESTVELCYKVSNVSDYDENIITIAENPTSDDFHGIRIKPTNITVHSGAITAADYDTHLGTNVCDEEIIHLIITIQAGVDTNKNLVTGYVNGCKNFQFEYNTGDRWSFPNSPAIFGSDTADLYLYMVRAYSTKPFSASSAEKNWISSLSDSEDKIFYKKLFESITGTGVRDVNYETIKNEGKYNFFVVERSDGGRSIPSKSYPESGLVNLEMHYGKDANGNDRYAWDWKIQGVKEEGQGTTSMNYWLWNQRWRIDKTSKTTDELFISYYDVPVVSGGVREFIELPASKSKTVWFDGEGNHPAVKRITAKINFASSMQSHKIGATMAYNLLHDSIFEGDLLNEAQNIAVSQGKPMPTVAVYEYPAFGFQRITDSLGKETYKFLGLFTIGPDKGDKPTFGYNLVGKSDLVTLEGTDHDPQMTLFKVPWDDQTSCTLNDKGDCFLSTKIGVDNYARALEVGNAGTADTEDTIATLAVLVDKFKPAYDVVYDNSTLIFPIALNDATWGGNDATEVLANINSDISNFTGTRYSKNERFTYSDLEFWIEGEYHLYHLELESNTYVSGKKVNGQYNSPLDLRVDTGVTPDISLSLDEQNELFREARRNRFLSDAPAYWDMREIAFNYVYLLIFGATDNFAKNQYPQYLGGKWRFRQDDLDTIMDIDNNGGQTKPSYIEFDDAPNGSPYFGGAASVLWNLVHESMWNDFVSGNDSYPGILSTGKEVLNTMTSLSHGDNTYDGFMKFFEMCFWDNAQKYFPQPAYNIDANIKYEDAWIGDINYTVPPLQQSLGNHYSAEILWTRRRAIYCLSLFGAGAFGDSSKTELGRIGFRPVGTTTFNITVAQPMYPCVFVGTNKRELPRTMVGDEQEFSVDTGGQGQTMVVLQATDNITGLGDLSKLQLSFQDSGNLTISGKRIRTILLGNEDPEEVDTNVQNLNISNGAPSLEIVDVRYASMMQGTLDLSDCRRIKEVYAEGTNISAVTLPRGSKVEVLHLGEGTTSISYQVVKCLYDLQLPSDPSGISTVYLEECDALDGISTISQIYDEDNSALTFIRILWGGEITSSGKQIRMLSNIEQNLQKDGTSHDYHGLTREGRTDSTMNPVIEGRIIADAYYQSDLDVLAGGQTPTDSTVHPGMKEIRNTYFGSLYITYSLLDAYIIFVDSEICSTLAEEVGDGDGVTKSQALATTNMDGIFENNATISTFDEFVEFPNITSANSIFKNSSLTKVTLPSGIVFENVSGKWGELFYGCSDLEEIDFSDAVRSQAASGRTFNWFTNCESLTTLHYESLEQVMQLANSSYQIVDVPFGYNSDAHYVYVNGSEITSLSIPSVTSIPAGSFYGWNRVTSVTIPSSVQTIGRSAFDGCYSITGTLVIPNNISVGEFAFANCIGLTNVVVYNGQVGSYANLSGTGFGIFWSEGDTILTGFSGYYNKLIFNGSVNANSITGGNICVSSSGNFVADLRIRGNLSAGLSSAGGFFHTYSATKTLAFFEIMGTINVKLFYGNNEVAAGFILHLGHTDIAGPASIVENHKTKFSVIYIGPGNSEQEDQEIINKYMLDPDWAEYENVFATWHSYNGQYKTMPTRPDITE